MQIWSSDGIDTDIATSGLPTSIIINDQSLVTKVNFGSAIMNSQPAHV